jgi:peptidoglycan/xylan/chitin deacetylase (PgdA/CDA1 family)
VTRTEVATRLLDLLRFLAPRRWNGLLSLSYHRIGDPSGSPLDRDTWSATTEEFDRQIALLQEHFDVVHPRDVVGLQQRGRGRHALVTFDDGSRDNHDLALPVLRRRGVPALFFVTTGFMDEPRVAWWDEISWMVWNSPLPALPPSDWLSDPLPLGRDRPASVYRLLRAFKSLPSPETPRFLSWLGEASGTGRCPVDESSAHWMSWGMVRALRDAGMAIGGHTVSHPILARMDRAAQEAEIEGCATRIRDELGEPMRWFAYPVGGPRTFDTATREVLAAADVELAFSNYGGIRRYGDWDPHDVRRISMELDMAGPAFRPVITWPTLVAPPRPQGWSGRLRETFRAWSGV